MIHSQPLMFDVEKLDPFTLRTEAFLAKHGLNIICPDIILPKFEYEPFTEKEIIAMAKIARWYKKANTSKLRSIIRKAKQK